MFADPSRMYPRAAAVLALGVVIVAAHVAVLPAPSAAQRGGRPRAAPEGPTSQQTEVARAAYAEGQRLFREGLFEQAQAQFEAAFAAVPNPIVLLSIAEVQERRGLVPEAVATLERYLQLRADAPDREQVSARIAQMRGRPGLLAIASEPSGAEIFVDGRSTGRRTPAEVELSPGEHIVRVVADGYEPAERSVTVAFGTRAEVNFPPLAALPPVEEPVDEPSAAEEPAPPAAPTPTSSGPSPAVWVAAGIGAVGMVAGTVLGFLALGEQSDFDDMPTEATADRGERYALFADVGFGVAAVGFLTALVLNFATGGDDDSGASEGEDAGSTSASVRRHRLRVGVAPVAAPGGAGVSARFVF
jgi:tetratricopeptide (TPR) repeat protein